MENPERRQYEKSANEYLRRIQDTYVLNESSGLYEPKSQKAHKSSAQETKIAAGKSPLWVSVKRDWIVIAISVATIVLLFVTAGYTSEQADDAQVAVGLAFKTSRENNRGFNLTLKETRRSAKAAEDAASIAKESLRSVQRAFLTATVREQSQYVDFTYMNSDNGMKGDAAILHIDWENSGATEAPVVVGVSTWTAVPQKYFSEWNFNQGQSFRPLSIEYLGPHSSFHDPVAIPKPFLYNPNSLFDPMPGSAIVIWGCKAYRDAFPGTEPHLTEMCYVVQGITRNRTQPNPTSIKVNLFRCNNHNCTDHHCADYKRMIAYLPK